MPLGARTSELAAAGVAFEPVAFRDLPGWETDDHLAALRAFALSAPALSKPGDGGTDRTQVADRALADLVQDAAAAHASIATRAGAKAFFEARFIPHRLRHAGAEGLLTGYYEPMLDGARTASDVFHVPIYRRPPDLVNLVREEERGALAGGLTHARQTADGPVPYATRADIENGALAGQGLELVWLADPVDAFFLHVQGSGRIRFADGESLRIAYDGKNGHPYTSIGRVLIDAGHFSPHEMTLAALKDWLTADPARGRKVMQENRSFIFFRALRPDEDGPLGARAIPLSEGRSLAVDTAFHALGTPIYVHAPALAPWPGSRGFARLMVAQDVGSAIRGVERGDIYFGSGDEAGRHAGSTKHAGRFYVLLPRRPALHD